MYDVGDAFNEYQIIPECDVRLVVAPFENDKMILQNDCIIFLYLIRMSFCRCNRNEMFIQIIPNKKFMNPFPTSKMSKNHSTNLFITEP